VAVSTTLPNELVLLNANTSVPDGSCIVTGNLVECMITRIIASSTEEVTINVTAPDSEAAITTMATATADQVDSNETGNSGTLSTTISNNPPTKPPANPPANTDDSSSGGAFDPWLLLFMAMIGLLSYSRKMKTQGNV